MLDSITMLGLFGLVYAIAYIVDENRIKKQLAKRFYKGNAKNLLSPRT